MTAEQPVVDRPMKEGMETHRTHERRNARHWLPALIPAGAALLLLVSSFFSGGGEPAATNVVTKKEKRDWTAERDAERQRLDEWRARNQVSLLDDTKERERKDFNRTMTALGLTPVEVIDASDSSRPPVVAVDSAQQMKDLKQLLKDGGHYSGPLPDGFFDETPASAPAGDAQHGDRR